MTRTAWIAELDRRIAACDPAEGKMPERIELESFRDWLASQPEPDASTLISKVNEMHQKCVDYEGQDDESACKFPHDPMRLMFELADALEAAEAKLAKARSFLAEISEGLHDIPSKAISYAAREALKEIGC